MNSESLSEAGSRLRARWGIVERVGQCKKCFSLEGRIKEKRKVLKSQGRHVDPKDYPNKSLIAVGLPESSAEEKTKVKDS